MKVPSTTQTGSTLSTNYWVQTQNFTWFNESHCQTPNHLTSGQLILEVDADKASFILLSYWNVLGPWFGFESYITRQHITQYMLIPYTTLSLHQMPSPDQHTFSCQTSSQLIDLSISPQVQGSLLLAAHPAQVIRKNLLSWAAPQQKHVSSIGFKEY